MSTYTYKKREFIESFRTFASESQKGQLMRLFKYN